MQVKPDDLTLAECQARVTGTEAKLNALRNGSATANQLDLANLSVCRVPFGRRNRSYEFNDIDQPPATPHR